MSVCCCFVSAYVGVFCVVCEHVGGFVVGVFFVAEFVGYGAGESSGFLVFAHCSDAGLQLVAAHAYVFLQPVLVGDVFFFAEAASVAELIPSSHEAAEHFGGVGEHPVVITIQVRKVSRRPKIQREPINRLRLFLQIGIALAVYAHGGDLEGGVKN